MAKTPKTTKPETETPFQRFQRLAKGLVGVPRTQIRNGERDKRPEQSS